ncbi:Neurofilament medium polypeptide [Paramuricea clavata]|uniref:Neurofilament medium polypeptide n=1 Tax=Paramuricea clavata TaxID=317549 RepID=A0A7D9H8Z3_PARCT|nr:Neurofilament medium polypeptide [Paramuricea clavata]
MRSPDGGKRDEKTILQHSAQLWSILLAIDSSCDINSLLDMMLIRNIFLETYVKNKKYEAVAIKSYLMSLRHFYSFLLSEKPDGVEFNVEDINVKREKIHFWSTTYKRDSCTRRWQKLEEDTENLLTSESIQNFEKSEAAREAIKIIGQYSYPTETAPVVQALYILARDFLLVELFIDNANRPGILSFMTTDKFHNMGEEDGTYVIAVKKHKTAHVHRPAYIVLSKKLKAWMHVFVEVMRPAVTDSDTSTSSVFLTWNSRSMTSGQVNKAVQSVFKKAGVDIKVTSTLFRKAAVTKMHESNPELSEKLAGLMSHNESTAKKYYLLWEKTKASIEASAKLGKLMRNQENSADESEADVSEDFNKSETKRRTPWKDDEIQIVNETFKEELKLKTITMGIVRDKVENSEQLDGMSPRRVYDRLKRELNKKQLNANEEVIHVLPTACESLNDRLERMASNSHGQTSYSAKDEQSSPSVISPTEFANTDLFSDSNLTSMKKIFADMIVNKPISKSEIKKRCSESKEGKPLISKLSVSQIMNRIKYERRKIRSAK